MTNDLLIKTPEEKMKEYMDETRAMMIEELEAYFEQHKEKATDEEAQQKLINTFFIDQMAGMGAALKMVRDELEAVKSKGIIT